MRLRHGGVQNPIRIVDIGCGHGLRNSLARGELDRWATMLS
jgi:hypothetical protein